jgi:DNA-binding transcriptional ArsR family regulator
MSDDTDDRRATRDYQLDDFADAGTPERLKALGDPLRSRICDLVLERAMSVTELAGRVGRPKGTVAYHVDVLVDAGLLKVAHTRRVRAIDERFYGRVARTFMLPDTSDELPFLRDVLAEVDFGAIDRTEAVSSDPTPGSYPGLTTYRRARIPSERATEYARRLHELALEFIDEPRDGDLEFGLYLALFPTNREIRSAQPTDPDHDDEVAS